jgi:alkaline phosphatase
MRRRSFFQTSAAGSLGLAGSGPLAFSAVADQPLPSGKWYELSPQRPAKNVIFMVSDGMSAGTFQLADLLARRRFGRTSHWVRMFGEVPLRRATMDTASLDSYVTDSAAASSAWGGGVRVNNGSLNVGPNQEEYLPIWQKLQAAGKAVGCVTTVPITHATPAGFCVSVKTRRDQSAIADQYLDLRFDVMLGGGAEFFEPQSRADGRDMYEAFRQDGYKVVNGRAELEQLHEGSEPVLGVFCEDALPYSIDHAQDPGLLVGIPTLAEMTRFAIDRMRNRPNGFALQIEGGKVDWAAHANDIGGLLYDQLAFDDALDVALRFALADQETLLIVTSDHGNANPGLIGTSGANKKFDSILGFRHSNRWILEGLPVKATADRIRERIDQALGVVVSESESQQLADHYAGLAEADLANPRRLPFALLADILKGYTGIGWAGDDHSGDFVELTVTGPGMELLPWHVRNTDLHPFMLQATGVKV